MHVFRKQKTKTFMYSKYWYNTLMENIQTLHSHTKNSDGALSHLEVLEICEDNNIAVVAITDHDTVIDGKSLKKLKAYEGNVKWISGIEISSGLPKELGGKATSDFHIVGLFVDPTNKKLKEHCILANEARVVRMQKMVSNLQGLGFDISENDCIKASGGEAVGRPHVVAALVSKEKNVEIIEKLRLDMKKEAEKNVEVKKKYDAMMEQGERQYPYIIFLSDDSFISDIYVDYQYFVDMDDSVKLIRDAGGIAILAHYFSCARKVDKTLLEKIFEEGRLDGAEVVYGLFCLNTGSEIERIVDDTLKVVRRLVDKHSKLKSGGADAHRSRDFKNFAKSGDYATQTCGMAENIVENSHVDTKWSNF
jgi:predicted metal-dependent phosphoesterase TrpH